MNKKKKSIKGLQFLGICGFFSSSNEEAEESGLFIVTKVRGSLILPFKRLVEFRKE